MADINFNEFTEEISELLSLNPEDDDGDCEYKRLLVNKDRNRLEELETQMQYRLSQGKGECRYCIGVDDDGTFFGLTDEENISTVKYLKDITKRNDCSLSLLQTVEKENKKASEFLIRENNIFRYKDLRIAIAGNVDAGKSSCLGVLVSGEKDNGKGSARLKVLNFKHESDSGRTSSVSQQIIGYDPEGKVVNYDKELKDVTWKEITKRSSKIITFFDLCGHTKYSKTTITGISSNAIDYGIVVVDGNKGVRGNTIEHVRILRMFKIPIIIFLTKVDMCKDKPEQLVRCIDKIKDIFRQPGNRKNVKTINNIDDILSHVENVKLDVTVPIFKLSNTEYTGFDLVHSFFNLLENRIVFDDGQDVEYHVQQTFKVKGIGTVLGGTLWKGKLQIGKEYYLGPYRDGSYKKIKVRTMEVKRTLVSEYSAGSYVCLATPKLERDNVEKGMVVLGKYGPIIRNFTADVFILETNRTTIRIGYQTVMNVKSLRVTITLVKILYKKRVHLKKSLEKIDEMEEDKSDILRLGDQARVIFKVSYRPVYINENDCFSMAESKVKAKGIVRELNPEC